MIEENSLYTNKEMLVRYKLLKETVMRTKEVKIREGRSFKKKEVLKYKTDKIFVDKILKNYEYYKNACELENKKRLTYRDYQIDIINKGSDILVKNRILYLAMEVRTGKTLTSFGIAQKIDAKKVLFITKKKAIKTIQDDYLLLNPLFLLEIINYESLHTVIDKQTWDMIICDEAHSMGAFPKPNKRAILVSSLIKRHSPMVVLLSGTPTPESYSQMYHQVYASRNNPFFEFKNFYNFCSKYVDVKKRNINGLFINDYKDGLPSIIEAMAPYTINYTQEEAGFKSKIKEEIIEVEMKESTYKMIKRIKKDLVIEGKNEVILADTPVKLLSKIHQLYSGTVKFESGNSMIIDLTKAEFIKNKFKDMKIGIFYKFKEEYTALKEVLGEELTSDLKIFEETNKSIALQISSGREGISLKQAKYLVYYNIDFSATSYWQSKDRMTTKDRLENHIYWIFSKGGIEHKIYKTVIEKKDYTINHFKKDMYE